MYGKGLYGQSKYSMMSDDTSQDDKYVNLIDYLPQFYHDVIQMNELQKILGYDVGNIKYASDDVKNQCLIATATWGLNRWEKVFGIDVDMSRSYEHRREVILAKLRGSGTTTKEMIKNVAMAFSGGEVAIQEFTEESRFLVQFIGIKGIPPNMAGLTKALEEIKPAHLAYSFKYTYTTWENVKRILWNKAEEYTWAEIKIYEGG